MPLQAGPSFHLVTFSAAVNEKCPQVHRKFSWSSLTAVSLSLTAGSSPAQALQVLASCGVPVPARHCGLQKCLPSAFYFTTSREGMISSSKKYEYTQLLFEHTCTYFTTDNTQRQEKITPPQPPTIQNESDWKLIILYIFLRELIKYLR